MDIRPLFSPHTIVGFVADYYQKLPYSAPSVGRDFRPLGSWWTVQTLLAAPRPDVMVVRQSRQVAEVPADLAAAQALVAEGHTLLVRHAERHHPGLAELAAAFERHFGDPVNIHLYATPPETHGFGWHYDAEEVFILQCTGRKEYSLRKNTVHPWPTEETLPADMGFEREIMPLVRCELAAGDLLYVPSGYWHMGTGRMPAEAEGASPPNPVENAAISLAIGITPRTALDLFDALRRKLPADLLWRTRLPLRGESAFPEDEGERLAQLRDLAALLSRDLSAALVDEAWLRQFLRDPADETPPDAPE